MYHLSHLYFIILLFVCCGAIARVAQRRHLGAQRRSHDLWRTTLVINAHRSDSSELKLFARRITVLIVFCISYLKESEDGA